MEKVLFFDTDDQLKKFFKQHLSGQAELFFTTESIYHPLAKNPPKDVRVISVFAHSQAITGDILKPFKNLQLLATRSTGYNHIDLDYCRQHNIVVANVPNYGESTVAEFTFGLILGLTRKIYPAKSDLKKSAVQLNKYMGIDLDGRTLGIVGAGAIGRHVAHLGHAFGMKILAYDPYPTQTPDYITYVPFEDLIKKSDIISLHCPATEQNTHLFNKKTFSKMKPQAFLINTARGSLVDTDALYEALQTHQIAGAALDVLENEDVLMQREIDLYSKSTSREALVDSLINIKLMQLDNVIITPHIAFNSTDAVNRILETTAQTISAFLAGKPTRSIA